jgi:N-acetylneuraminic acid mutarotase
MVAIESNIYIFGGIHQTNYIDEIRNDLYKIDTTTFVSTKIELESIDNNNSNIPTPRYQHSMVAIESNIYIFGGETNDGKLNDFYKIDTTTNYSTKIELLPESSKPPPSYDNYMTVIGNYIYIFDGTTDSGRLNDFYKIDTEGNSTQITPDNTDELRTPGSIVTINNNIYKVIMQCSTRGKGQFSTEEFEITSTGLQKLIKITPTIRDHHLDGNIAELRINNVITSDSEIIDNYSNLNNNYNLT